MADYPGAIPNFGANEVDGVDYNYAAHINKLRLEVVAIATELGIRGGLSTSIATRLATALSQSTTVSGYFDGSGKMPHSRMQGVIGATGFQNPQTTWDNFFAAQNSAAGWRVTAAGMCVWSGAITIGPNANQVVLTGAPAPADARIHSFKIRRGLSGGSNPAPLASPFIALADYSSATSQMARPAYFVDEGGMCHVSGVIYLPGSISNGVANPIISRLPIPADQANHVFSVPPLGGSGGITTVATIDNTGGLYTGAVERGAGNVTIVNGYGGAYVNWPSATAYSLDHIHYQVHPSSLSMDVLADGTGYYNGPDITATQGHPYDSSEYLWLDGIQYFVGPGTS